MAGYTASLTVSDAADWPRILIWFAAAIIAHVLFSLYVRADRSLPAGLRALRPHPRPGPPRVPTVNYLRLPLLGTGLLFLLFVPGIIKQGASSYVTPRPRPQQPFLDRWLLLTAAMFGLSAILYAARLGYTHRRPATAPLAPLATADGDPDETRAHTPVPGA